jgi:hypothetical protein
MICLRNPARRHCGSIGPPTSRRFLRFRAALRGVGDVFSRRHECAVFFQRTIFENVARIGVAVDLR